MVGKVHKVGNDIDTDAILPGKYLSVTDAKELAAHCMEGLDPGFTSKVRPGDLLFAGGNFGCGSSREHAVIAVKETGIAAIIAESFARIFYRNSINNGLPVLECEEAVRETEEGDEVEVDLKNGLVVNRTKGKTFHAIPQPAFILTLYESGGLLEYINKR